MKSRKTRVFAALWLVAISGFSLMIAAAATDVKLITTDLTNAIQRIPRVQIVSNNYAKKATLSNVNHLFRINTEYNGFVVWDDSSKAVGTGSSVLWWNKNTITTSSNSTIIAWSGSRIKNSNFAVILWWDGNVVDWTSNESVVVWGTNNKINSKWVDSVIVGWSNNVISSSTNINNAIVLWSGSKVTKTNSIAFWESSINQSASSFLWTDSNHTDALNNQDNVFAVVANSWMVVNKDMPHSFAQLTIWWSLTITKSSLNPACTNGNNKWVLKVVDNTSNPNVSCFCACDGYNWVSLFGAWMCNSSCKTSIKPVCDNSKVRKVCPTAGQYEYVWECIQWEVVNGTGAYLVEEDWTVRRTCETNNGVTAQCATKNIEKDPTCHDVGEYECAWKFDNAYFLTWLASNLGWNDDLNSKLFESEAAAVASGVKCAFVCSAGYHIRWNQCVENRPCVGGTLSWYTFPALSHGASTWVSQSFDVPEWRKTCTATVSCFDAEPTLIWESCSLTEHCQEKQVDGYRIPAFNLWTYTVANKTWTVVVWGRTEWYYSCDKNAYCDAGNSLLTWAESCTYWCYAVTKSWYSIEALQDGVTVTRRGNTWAIEWWVRVCDIDATCRSGAVILSNETCRNEMNPCGPQNVGSYSISETWAFGETGWVFRSWEGEAAWFSWRCQRLAECSTWGVLRLVWAESCNFKCGWTTPTWAGVKTWNGNFTSETYRPKTWTFTWGTLNSCLWKCDNRYRQNGNKCVEKDNTCLYVQWNPYLCEDEHATVSNTWYVNHKYTWKCEDNPCSMCEEWYNLVNGECVSGVAWSPACGTANQSRSLEKPAADTLCSQGTATDPVEAIVGEPWSIWWSWKCDDLDCWTYMPSSRVDCQRIANPPSVPAVRLADNYIIDGAWVRLHIGAWCNNGEREDIYDTFKYYVSDPAGFLIINGAYCDGNGVRSIERVDIVWFEDNNYNWHRLLAGSSCTNNDNAECGTANGTTRDSMPATYDELCKVGLPTAVNGNGEGSDGWSWSCEKDWKTPAQCKAWKTAYECIWTVPSNATFVTWSDQWLTSDVTRTLYASASAAAWKKCAYYCPSTTWQNGNKCVEKDNTCLYVQWNPYLCEDDHVTASNTWYANHKYTWKCMNNPCNMCEEWYELDNNECVGSGEYTLLFTWENKCTWASCGIFLHLTLKNSSWIVVPLPDELSIVGRWSGGWYSDHSTSPTTLQEWDVFNWGRLDMVDSLPTPNDSNARWVWVNFEDWDEDMWIWRNHYIINFEWMRTRTCWWNKPEWVQWKLWSATYTQGYTPQEWTRVSDSVEPNWCQYRCNTEAWFSWNGSDDCSVPNVRNYRITYDPEDYYQYDDKVEITFQVYDKDYRRFDEIEPIVDFMIPGLDEYFDFPNDQECEYDDNGIYNCEINVSSPRYSATITVTFANEDEYDFNADGTITFVRDGVVYNIELVKGQIVTNSSCITEDWVTVPHGWNGHFYPYAFTGACFSDTLVCNDGWFYTQGWWRVPTVYNNCVAMFYNVWFTAVYLKYWYSSTYGKDVAIKHNSVSENWPWFDPPTYCGSVWMVNPSPQCEWWNKLRPAIYPRDVTFSNGIKCYSGPSPAQESQLMIDNGCDLGSSSNRRNPSTCQCETRY